MADSSEELMVRLKKVIEHMPSLIVDSAHTVSSPHSARLKAKTAGPHVQNLKLNLLLPFSDTASVSRTVTPASRSAWNSSTLTHRPVSSTSSSRSSQHRPSPSYSIDRNSSLASSLSLASSSAPHRPSSSTSTQLSQCSSTRSVSPSRPLSPHSLASLRAQTARNSPYYVAPQFGNDMSREFYQDMSRHMQSRSNLSFSWSSSSLQSSARQESPRTPTALRQLKEANRSSSRFEQRLVERAGYFESGASEIAYASYCSGWTSLPKQLPRTDASTKFTSKSPTRSARSSPLVSSVPLAQNLSISSRRTPDSNLVISKSNNSLQPTSASESQPRSTTPIKVLTSLYERLPVSSSSSHRHHVSLSSLTRSPSSARPSSSSNTGTPVRPKSPIVSSRPLFNIGTTPLSTTATVLPLSSISVSVSKSSSLSSQSRSHSNPRSKTRRSLSSGRASSSVISPPASKSCKSQAPQPRPLLQRSTSNSATIGTLSPRSELRSSSQNSPTLQLDESLVDEGHQSQLIRSTSSSPVAQVEQRLAEYYASHPQTATSSFAPVKPMSSTSSASWTPNPQPPTIQKPRTQPQFASRAMRYESSSALSSQTAARPSAPRTLKTPSSTWSSANSNIRYPPGSTSVALKPTPIRLI